MTGSAELSRSRSRALSLVIASFQSVHSVISVVSLRQFSPFIASFRSFDCIISVVSLPHFSYFIASFYACHCHAISLRHSALVAGCCGRIQELLHQVLPDGQTLDRTACQGIPQVEITSERAFLRNMISHEGFGAFSSKIRQRAPMPRRGIVFLRITRTAVCKSLYRARPVHTMKYDSFIRHRPASRNQR